MAAEEIEVAGLRFTLDAAGRLYAGEVFVAFGAVAAVLWRALRVLPLAEAWAKVDGDEMRATAALLAELDKGGDSTYGQVLGGRD